jgi:PAS domain S-box-containing protein
MKTDLQASSALLRLESHAYLVELLPLAAYAVRAPDGVIAWFNSRATELWGRVPAAGDTDERFCGAHRLHRPDGTYMAHCDTPVALALSTGVSIHDEEVVIERPDGSRVTVSVHIDPIRDQDGSIVGAVNFFQDITQRKQAERADSLLAAIVGSSDDAIVSKNLDGVITSWNKGAERLFGHTAEEAVGKRVTLVIPADRLDEEATILEQLKRGERVEHFETVRIHKDGTLLDISLTISPMRNAAGAVIGASKVARNITERKLAERALRESEERFRAMVDTTPECVKLVTTEGTLLHMNSPGLTMVGADCAEKVVGKSVYDLIAPHDRDRFRSFNERICRGEKGSLEFDMVGLDGVNHRMDTHAAPLRLADGGVVQLAVTRDITERVRVQERLRRNEEQLRILADDLERQVRTRTQELEQRNAEILHQSDQLRQLSNRLLQLQENERRHIARELHDSAGQAIAALGMNLASMARHVTKNPILGKSVEDCQSLVQQLSKEIRTTSYLLHPPLLDENGLTEAIRWYMQGLTERSGLNIDLDIAENFGRLPTEMEMAVFRIVQECLTNIHRHSGSKTATIRLSRNRESVALEILDEGSGIAAEKLDGIRAQRSGVGITGMRERVRHLKGSMEIHSNGAGTKISVTLPVLDAEIFELEDQLQEQRTGTTG